MLMTLILDIKDSEPDDGLAPWSGVNLASEMEDPPSNILTAVDLTDPLPLLLLLLLLVDMRPWLLGASAMPCIPGILDGDRGGRDGSPSSDNESDTSPPPVLVPARTNEPRWGTCSSAPTNEFL